MSNDNEILSDFTKNVLNSEKSIRWVGITDQNGIIINEKHREGLKLLLNNEENQESAVNTITRHKSRTTFEPKIGKLTRSEEHTSELQSQSNLVCRLLLEKKKKKKN